MRRGKFCPRCGKATGSLYDNLCRDCFLEKMKLPNIIPEKIVVGTCKMCGNIFLKEKKFETVEGAVEFFLENILKREEIKSATYRISGNRIFLTIGLEDEGIEKEVEKETDIVNKAITCKFCNLKKASFYNATIQVRVPKSIQAKIVEEIEGQIARRGRFDNYSFVSGTERMKGGVDIFVGSKDAAEEAVKYLKRKYNVKTKFSRKLYGLVQGKKSYRDTILVSISD